MYVVASHKCWTYAVHRRTPLKKKGVAISQYSIDNRHYFQASVDQCTTSKIGAMFPILADALLKCSPWLRSRLGVPSSAGSLGFSARFAWTSSTWLPRRRQKRIRKLRPCTCAVLEAMKAQHYLSFLPASPIFANYWVLLSWWLLSWCIGCPGSSWYRQTADQSFGVLG